VAVDLTAVGLALLRRACARFGMVPVARARVFDWQVAPLPVPAPQVDDEARAWLRPDHPHLRELEARYRRCPPEVTTPLAWAEGHIKDSDLPTFRGDNAYVWQTRGRNMNPPGYALSAYYARTHDAHALFARLEEDGAFGAYTLEAAGRRVSRDLLDSLCELDFLARHCALFERAAFRVVDIGAGYGRLAHRMLAACPHVSAYLLTDAVPVSSFIAEYYVRHRALGLRAEVVPLDAIEARLAAGGIDLALNVHSFSECTLAAIEWWVQLLVGAGVRHLFVVPNNLTPGTPSLLNGRRDDFAPLLARAGYRCVVVEPKYRDPLVQQYGVNPAWYHLFELG